MLTLTYAIISYGNIIFDLCLFDSCPLFQEHNLSIKKRAWSIHFNKLQAATVFSTFNAVPRNFPFLVTAIISA
jgi:hypothetical protein